MEAVRGLPDYTFVIVVSGSREATEEQCDRYVLPELKKITEQCQSGVSVLIVHGDCPGKAGKPGGVDAYVKRWIEHARPNLPTLDDFPVPYPSGHGRAGGPKRNRFMVMGALWFVARGASMSWCLAFPEVAKPCHGTRGTIELCERYGLSCRVTEME